MQDNEDYATARHSEKTTQAERAAHATRSDPVYNAAVIAFTSV